MPTRANSARFGPPPEEAVAAASGAGVGVGVGAGVEGTPGRVKLALPLADALPEVTVTFRFGGAAVGRRGHVESHEVLRAQHDADAVVDGRYVGRRGRGEELPAGAIREVLEVCHVDVFADADGEEGHAGRRGLVERLLHGRGAAVAGFLAVRQQHDDLSRQASRTSPPGLPATTAS